VIGDAASLALLGAAECRCRRIAQRNNTTAPTIKRAIGAAAIHHFLMGSHTFGFSAGVNVTGGATAGGSGVGATVKGTGGAVTEGAATVGGGGVGVDWVVGVGSEWPISSSALSDLSRRSRCLSSGGVSASSQCGVLR